MTKRWLPGRPGDAAAGVARASLNFRRYILDMSIINGMPVMTDAPVVCRVSRPNLKAVDSVPVREPALEAVPQVSPLPDVMLEPLVRETLREDLGRAGDLTSNLIIPAEAQVQLKLAAREAGVLAGLDLARIAFAVMDGRIRFNPVLRDGARLQPGDVIATVEGPAREILSAERTALNFLCHLSGVASATARIADAIRPYGTRVTCTRKTLPGLRMVQKYAVRVGGGSNHRYGLDDAILIKDNHVAVAGGGKAAGERARRNAGQLVAIGVEVDTPGQVPEGLDGGANIILLDNLPPAMLRTAVSMVNGRAVTEASGRVTLETVADIARAGVDYIAVGAITHSVAVLDIGLDALPAQPVAAQRPSKVAGPGQ